MGITVQDLQGGVSGPGFMRPGFLDCTGKRYWVQSTSANKANDPAHGDSPDRPFSTWVYARARASADSQGGKGALIVLMEGHAESVIAAAGLDLDVAGLRTVGLGQGSNRPTITFSTATTADIDIDAANVVIERVRFVCAIDSLAAAIDVNSTGFEMRDCEFVESSATGLTWVDINGGAANACDGARIVGNVFNCKGGANWDRAIELGEVADDVQIVGNYIFGDFDDAGIHNVTGKVLTNLLLKQNVVQNTQTGDHAIELVSACTGFAIDNRLFTDAQATGFDAGALACAGNLWNDTTGGDTEGAPVNPTVDTGTNFIGVDDSNNVAATSSVAANRDGTILERLEHLIGEAGSYSPQLGFIVTKSGTLATDPLNLFTVTGKVALTLLTGEVTTVVATTTTLLLELASGAPLCAATTITTDADGTMYIFGGDVGDVLNGAEVPVVGIATGNGKFNQVVIGNAGGTETIRHNLDGAGTGIILWTLAYWPLEASASVVAA